MGSQRKEITEAIDLWRAYRVLQKHFGAADPEHLDRIKREALNLAWGLLREAYRRVGAKHGTRSGAEKNRLAMVALRNNPKLAKKIVKRAKSIVNQPAKAGMISAADMEMILKEVLLKKAERPEDE